MHTLRALTLALAAVGPVAGLGAQKLIGMTGTAPLLVQQELDCKVSSCLLSMPKQDLSSTGGTAFDARRNAVWVSSGRSMALVDADTCRLLCRPFQPVGDVTGLAMHEPSDTLIYSTFRNALFFVRNPRCPLPAAYKVCPMQGALPAGYTIGGVAVDDVTGMVFFAASDFTNPAATPMLYTVLIQNPCQIICSTPLRACGSRRLGPVTGVAYDPCKRIVHVTDGRQTAGFRVLSATSCQLAADSCCPMPLRESYIGLCILPARARSSGTSCTARPCPSCPAMVHDTIGAPTIGNPGFGLQLRNAPAQSSAYLVLSVGPCQGPGIPFGCGRVQTALPIGAIVGPLPTGGSSGCTGKAAFKLPLAASRNLCGVTLSSQYLVLCRGLPFGTGVSNCLTWSISGS